MNSALRRWRQVDPRISLARQSNLLGKLQVNERPCLKNENQHGQHEEQQTRLSSGFYMHVHVHVRSCIYACTLTCREEIHFSISVGPSPNHSSTNLRGHLRCDTIDLSAERPRALESAWQVSQAHLMHPKVKRPQTRRKVEKGLLTPTVSPTGTTLGTPSFSPSHPPQHSQSKWIYRRAKQSGILSSRSNFSLQPT